MCRRLFWVAPAIIFFLFSCEKCGQKNETPRSALRINFSSPPPSLDPRKGGDTISSSLQFMLYEGLTKATPESDHAPAAAESYEISEDGLCYTFHLRDSKWSNGDPVTSTDFAESWKAMLNPEFPSTNANLLYAIKNAEERKMGQAEESEVGIYCPDPRTLVVHLKRPSPYFLKLTSYCSLAPTNQKIVNNHPSWADTASENFVCNGPFYLQKYAINDELILVKNEKYWDAENVQLNHIDISLISNSSTVFDLYEQGQIDLIGMPLIAIPPDYIPHVKQRGDLQVFPIAATSSIYFNTGRFPFTNKNIRKALGLSINRRSLVQHVSQLGDIVGVDNMPPVVKRGQITAFIKDDDLASARLCLEKGLKEIGITKEELPEITLIYGHESDEKHKIVQILQEHWLTKLGIKVQLKAVDFKVYLSSLVGKDYDIAMGGWVFQFNDVINGLERYKYKRDQKNHPGWENQEYIRLLNESALCKTEDERYAVLERAEAILMDEMPTVALYHRNNAMLSNPRLHGVYITPTGHMHIEYAYFK